MQVDTRVNAAHSAGIADQFDTLQALNPEPSVNPKRS
jgi:hypothetical protein